MFFGLAETFALPSFRRESGGRAAGEASEACPLEVLALLLLLSLLRRRFRSRDAPPAPPASRSGVCFRPLAGAGLRPRAEPPVGPVAVEPSRPAFWGAGGGTREMGR